MSKLKIAVVIPTYNREEALITTLRSILATLYPSSARKILVVDQTTSHQPETSATLEQLAQNGDITWLRPPEITFASLTKARNVGISWAQSWQADLITFIDDDVTVEPDFLDIHAAAFSDSSVGATAGRITVPGHHYPESNPTKIFGVGFFGAFHNNFYGTELVENGNGFVGCNFTVRVSALTETGIFDEQFIGNAMREESDLAMRFITCGYRIPYLPQAHVMHYMQASGGTRAEARRQWYYSFFHNHFLFFGKHYPSWRIPFFILGLLRPILACWLYYGKGSFYWAQAAWQGIVSGLSAASASKHTGTAVCRH